MYLSGITGIICKKLNYKKHESLIFTNIYVKNEKTFKSIGNLEVKK